MQTYTKQSRSRYDRGIAVAPILFVVAILAVLVGALSSGSGGLGSDVSPERARVLGAQIVQQANLVRDAVQRVRANGCTDTEISFENGVVAGYTNSNSPLASKPWCHVFQPQGGGITWQSFPSGSGSLRYSTGMAVSGVGRNCDNDGACAELTLSLNSIPTWICLGINQVLGTTTPTDTNPIDKDSYWFDPIFAGTYSNNNNKIDDISGQTVLNGKTAACAVSSGSSSLAFFYMVLVPR